MENPKYFKMGKKTEYNNKFESIQKNHRISC